MKFQITLLSFFLLFLSTIEMNAGNETKTFADFYKSHKHKETVSMNIPGLFVRFLFNEEDEEVKELAKDIKNLKLLIFDDQSNAQDALTKELNQYLPSKLYHDLMVIRDGSDRVTFKLREEKGKIKEIIMIAQDISSSVVLCINGEMELEDAKKMVKSINVENLKEQTSD